MRALVSASIAAFLLMAAAPAHSAALDGNAIKATFFNGQPFTASTPSRVKYTMVFTPDGKATREPQGKAGAKGEGTWKVVKEGFCTTWGKEAKRANCYRLVQSGENKWSVMKGATVVAIWTK